MKTITAAAIQMSSSADADRNLADAQRLIGQACELGPQLVSLPELFVCLSADEGRMVALAERFGEGPVQSFLSRMAREHRIHLVGGSIPLRARAKGKVTNTSLLFDPAGKCVARYDKIHLFQYRGKTEAHDERETMSPGRRIVAHDAPFGRVGLSICYDLRFPELYRAMGRPDIVTVPSAFTVPTGRDHWELLVRARAVENQCHVVAACQHGAHDGGRRTWGHTIIVNPWGEVLAHLDDGEGVCSAILDADFQGRCRGRLPALDNRAM